MTFFHDLHTTVYQGDAREVLRTLPERSVQTVVTSPPYLGLRDYKVPGQIGLEKSVDEYVAVVVDVFREVRRVLRDDGTCWINLGDGYANDGKWGGATGGKHANGLHGGSGVGRQRQHTGLKPKDLMGVPWAVAFALRADGWWLRSDIVWSKPNPMPESVRDRPTRSHEYIFLLSKRERYYMDMDAIREPAAYRTDERPFGNAGGDRHGDEGRIYTPPSHKGSTFTAGKTGVNGQGRVSDAERHDNPAGRNKRSVWEIATQPYPDAHFATFPEALVRPCILAGTSERACECGAPWERIIERKYYGEKMKNRHDLTQGGNRNELGGQQFYNNEYVPPQTLGWHPTCRHEAPTQPCVVLDPFAGSGTTALVARKAGRRAILIELSGEYCELIVDRIGQGVLL